MRELLLGQRSFPRNWLVFLAVGLALSQSFPWFSLSLPPIWLFTCLFPLYLCTSKLVRNEEMLASGQTSWIETRSYLLQLRLTAQAALMTGLLLLVQPGLSGLKYCWIYLPLSLLLHPLPVRKRLTLWVWLAVYATAICHDGVQALLPILIMLALFALCHRLKLSSWQLNLAPQPGTDNPYEYRVCRLLQRGPYSQLVLSFWVLSVYGFYAAMSSGDRSALLLLAPAMGCGSLVLLSLTLHKERVARCYQLTPTQSQERRQGLSRPILRLGRNYCWALALAIQPLWLLIPDQATTLIHLTCQLALIGPLTGTLLAPAVFDAGTSKSPVTGFWLSILVIYLLGFIPGLGAEALLCSLAPL